SSSCARAGSARSPGCGKALSAPWSNGRTSVRRPDASFVGLLHLTAERRLSVLRGSLGSIVLGYSVGVLLRRVHLERVAVLREPLPEFLQRARTEVPDRQQLLWRHRQHLPDALDLAATQRIQYPRRQPQLRQRPVVHDARRPLLFL